ncbi:MAG TPA: NAD-dependent epimerase/dehydratase family protein [Thermoanaerobaculia bacterium]|nr:NAD-dependent epimerase/dehydratase family protein [Thermoanaerobaculia bacterium]
MPSAAPSFAGTRALVTGGAGFIGSNLAIALVRAGASVSVVDAMIPGYGGNLFNLDPVKGSVSVDVADIRDADAMARAVRGVDIVFHLAGQMDHVLSLKDPFPDIDINIKGTTVLMEALKHHNPSARVVYTGTRGEYGPADSLPVSEDAPTNPRGLHEISNLAAAKIVEMYGHVHGIRGATLRLSNIYGPRAQMRHSRYGVVNWFVRLALDGTTIPVFGDGKILRDFLYVDDCVDAILLAAGSDAALGQVLNVGGGEPTTFREVAETLRALTGTPWELAPFSAERKAQEPGDFYSDISKIRRVLGWRPKTPLVEGLERTLAYYRGARAHYW